MKDINVLFKAKDGRTVPVLFSASLAERDEVPVGVVVTAHDMTSYVEVSENLRRSEERYRTLVENALVGIGIHQDNKVVYANPVLVKMLGYTADEVVGIRIADVIAVSYTHLDVYKRQGRPPLEAQLEPAKHLSTPSVICDGTSFESLSPDGNWAVFVRDFNLYVRDILKGEIIRLTEDGDEEYY